MSPATNDDIAIPILPSKSTGETLAFYRKLGFAGEVIGESDSYTILCRGTIELHFFGHAALNPTESFAGCYIRVADAASLFEAFACAELPRHGIPRLDPLEDKPWGMREFAIVDPSGNLLRIGQAL